MIWNDGPIYADEFGLEQQKLNSFLGLNGFKAFYFSVVILLFIF
jgi:hypothetical protein